MRIVFLSTWPGTSVAQNEKSEEDSSFVCRVVDDETWARIWLLFGPECAFLSHFCARDSIIEAKNYTDTKNTGVSDF